VARTALKLTTFVLFYGYVGLLIVAGAWGIVFAEVDVPLLTGLDLDQVPADAAVNLLSQYRFLRAIELGFGVFALMHRHEIFANVRYNALFLSVMAAGVGARLLSLVVDGTPSATMLFFLVTELAGVVAIFVYSRGTLAARAG
jgi:hypothetical protein